MSAHFFFPLCADRRGSGRGGGWGCLLSTEAGSDGGSFHLCFAVSKALWELQRFPHGAGSVRPAEGMG